MVRVKIMAEGRIDWASMGWDGGEKRGSVIDSLPLSFVLRAQERTGQGFVGW